MNHNCNLDDNYSTILKWKKAQLMKMALTGQKHFKMIDEDETKMETF